VAVEIERKFLVAGDGWRQGVRSQTRMLQGYLANQATGTVRLRVAGERAYLTIKGPGHGIRRSEYEYPIPRADAEAMLREMAASPPIEKTRYRVPVGDHVWEVDVFAGANAGLVLAEVELGAEDEVFARPDWLGAEVTGDPRFYNVNLARHPYGGW